ncbi:hypothetical protein F485_gp119 [Aeromonas phage CC2]|uniref:Uncharacterized protein n=1 Tax=Aeromonas phage CC2 TaxID=1204516 RepID=I6XL55_9CAUD|nr:hypothetical protein F485_gp119 [Aeromonas phage CC2]AFN39249.1 hypothetical protein CC2_183 [Aeromonas phage CC2]
MDKNGGSFRINEMVFKKPVHVVVDMDKIESIDDMKELLMIVLGAMCGGSGMETKLNLYLPEELVETKPFLKRVP